MDIQQISAKLVKARFGDSVSRAIESTLTKEVAEVAKKHGKIATASAWIPVPGADVAAFAGNIWVMYARINDKLGIKLSDNLLKSIGSAVVANITSTLAIEGAASLLKAIPGVGTLLGGAIMSGASYKATMLAASIYMHALTRIVGQSGNNISDAALRNAINAELRNK